MTLYCSHEALALEYDRALTRVARRPGLRAVRTLPVGRRAHPPTRRRAHRLHLPAGQPDRRQARSGDHAGHRDRAVSSGSTRTTSPGRLTLISPDGQRPGPRRACTTDPGEGQRGRAQGRLAVRPDARQHHRVVQRVQDPPVRPHRRRGPRLLRGARHARHPPGRACTSS